MDQVVVLLDIIHLQQMVDLLFQVKEMLVVVLQVVPTIVLVEVEVLAELVAMQVINLILVMVE